jgi:hypothetical protein
MTESLSPPLAASSPRVNWWRAALRRSLFAAAVLATLIALFFAEENWRGRRAWERFQAEWEAKGVKFSIVEVMPPPVPDEQNMAMHPLFKPMFNYRLNFESGLTWLDTNGLDRLDKLTPHPREVSAKANKVKLPYEAWPFGTGAQDRTNGVKLANISRWPEYYRLDTNFAAMPAASTPALEVLRYLDRHEPTLALLEEALTWPQSQFPWKTEGQVPSAVLLPHLGKMKGITALLCVRATARIEAGQSDAALRDVERAWRLCDSLEHEPFLISQLVQISIQAMTVGCIAHGTAMHRWEERHLQRLDELLRPASKLKNLQFAIRGEAALMAQQLTMMERDRTLAANEVAKMAQMVGAEGERVVKNADSLNRFVAQRAPAGWYFQSLAREEAALLGHLSASFADAEQRRFFRQNPPTVPAKLWFDRFWPFKNVEGSFLKTAAKCARLQTNFDHARLAVALERHWLRHRAYPEKLDALVPEFLDRLPHDLFDGQPMRYRREGEQGFVLWSIGFDDKDDNAGPLHFAGNQGGSVGEELGDLVWRYPQAK